ncbi:methionine--tRNA ligase [Candidatus Aquiluna sp. UB-MaderosW2red]|uniref:methionine--tRNA ligase n=1 Tax=Candidatus Aquiluna sp. UB-MaderosW2red TaxID=1855377 RepID=UPI000875E99E|nr:methionine--tRNA ligase [Candidatus Aquiluna sp. UB-MaderosW2red]SCX08667.1 methionyl-tRNA synthetase [Candidatus Aquiluna sp. UB-MaderosW2red]
MSKSFYVTTPIFYVNDAPHIGHAYTEVASDVLTRWHRQRGENTFLLTGTDEHGEKVLRSALGNHVSPKEWTDKLVTESWLPLLETIDIDNQDFIRTTEPRHKVAVQKFLQQLYDGGFIYQGSFEGNYCVGCEEYKNDGDLVLGTLEFAGVKVCAIHSKPVEQLNETNYFFKLSDFQQRLLDHYEQNPTFIQPESARNEVISFVRSGLSDLSISRSKERFDWGIDIPWDQNHITYVWFDALLNYITAIGYGVDDEKLNSLWPADVQVVGKDILRFHAVIWPAMLMAAELLPPKQVFGHGWLLVGGEKMSKSKLTGIAPTQITDIFGSDAFRYYFMKAIGFGSDGSFSWEDLSARYNSELANGFGNLASRTIAMVNRYFDGVVQAPGEYLEADLRVQRVAIEAVTGAEAAIDKVAIHDAIAKSWLLVDELNSYITQQEPWVLAKQESNNERLATVLYTALEGLRVLATLLNPITPKACKKLWGAIGESIGELDSQSVTNAASWGQLAPGVKLGELEALFPRVEEQ